MSEHRVYRVTVRGRFDGLSERTRRRLVAARAEHDIFESAFTAEGTLTYDDRITFFNLRYEVRAGTETEALDIATSEAERFLTTMDFGYRGLEAKAADMTAMWQSTRAAGQPA